jgi:hypothetical protein
MVIPWKMAKKTVRKRTVLKNSPLFLCIFRFTSVPHFETVHRFKGSGFRGLKFNANPNR